MYRETRDRLTNIYIFLTKKCGKKLLRLFKVEIRFIQGFLSHSRVGEGGGGGGGVDGRNFRVGMYCWDPGTLSLY